jgi:hypothetical protein
LGRELKAAEEFFALAKTAPSPFMRSYCQRVAERYLSSQGELKPLKARQHRSLAKAKGSPAGLAFLGQDWLNTWTPVVTPQPRGGECHDGAIEQSGSLPERGGQIPRIG